MMNYSNAMPQRKFAISLDEAKRDWILRLARSAPELNAKDIGNIVGTSDTAVYAVLNQKGEEEAEQWRERVLEYLEDHPDATDAQVAQTFDLLMQSVNLVRRKMPPKGTRAPILTGMIGADLRDLIIQWATESPESSAEEIAEIVGEQLGRKVSKSTVYAVAVSAGIDRSRVLSPQQRVRRARKSRVEEYLRAHPEMTIKEFSAALGLSKRELFSHFRDAGITEIAPDYRGPGSGRVEGRDLDILDYIRKHPEKSFTEIAAIFGVGKGRPGKIAKVAGIKRSPGPAPGTPLQGGRKPRPPQPYRNPQRSAPPHYSYPRLPQMPFKLPKSSPQQVVDYVLYHPEATMRDLERQFAMSYDELQAILQQAGVTPSRARWNVKKNRWEG